MKGMISSAANDKIHENLCVDMPEPAKEGRALQMWKCAADFNGTVGMDETWIVHRSDAWAQWSDWADCTGECLRTRSRRELQMTRVSLEECEAEEIQSEPCADGPCSLRFLGDQESNTSATGTFCSKVS